MNKQNTPQTEYIEIWDWDTASPTGEKVDRNSAHKYGISHEGVHLWVIRNTGEPEILFQKRAEHKDMFPGCLDITVGGHVPFGRNEKKIQKEAHEEIGINPSDDDLVDLGYFRYEEKYGDLFHREFQRVYLLLDNRLLEKYKFTDGEVSGIYAVNLNDLKKLLIADYYFNISGCENGVLLSKKASRKDFHPLLFTKPMKEYMDVVIAAVMELLSGGKVKLKMKI